jgi:hypothetical protein
MTVADPCLGHVGGTASEVEDRRTGWHGLWMAGYPSRLLMVMTMKNTITTSLTTH